MVLAVQTNTVGFPCKMIGYTVPGSSWEYSWFVVGGIGG